jgi:hypothetical protein
MQKHNLKITYIIHTLMSRWVCFPEKEIDLSNATRLTAGELGLESTQFTYNLSIDCSYVIVILIETQARILYWT